MLRPAVMYEDELKKEVYKTWYEPKYQYYYAGSYHPRFSLAAGSDNGDYYSREFVSVDSIGKIHGMFEYAVNHDTKAAYQFSAMHFTDTPLPFSMDFAQVIDDIFMKFRHSKMEWWVVCGNKAEHMYDRFVEIMDGRIVGRCTKNATDMGGRLCDSKLYELMRENYMKNRSKTMKGVDL